MQAGYPKQSTVEFEPAAIGRPRTIQRVGRALLAIAAVGALLAMATSLEAISSAGPETLILQVWQSAGFAVFAGLFGLLAYRPLHFAGVWELVILNKFALTVVALTYASGAEGSGDTAIFDGALTVILLLAYVLCRGWLAWTNTGIRGGQRRWH